MSKERIPYFDFYPVDFMNGVRGLTAQEVGVYTMILCRIYEENGPVEMHPVRLATYCGMTLKTFEKCFEKLVELDKFQVENGMVSNRRAMSEISARESKLKSASQAGKISAEKRQQKQRRHATTVEQPFNQAEADTEAKLSSLADAPPREKLDDMTRRLLDAVGDANIQPHGALNLSAILGLIEAGIDFETDVLPTIRVKAQRLKRPAGSWAYFVPAIQDAYSARIAAGKGVTKRATPEASDRRWQTRLTMARAQGQWSTAEWGPAPGQPGCFAPKHLLQPGDGEGWREWQSEAA